MITNNDRKYNILYKSIDFIAFFEYYRGIKTINNY